MLKYNFHNLNYNYILKHKILNKTKKFRFPPTSQVHFHQHKIPHPLVGILKSEGKSFHDRMDVPAKVIDSLLAKELACQS